MKTRKLMKRILIAVIFSAGSLMVNAQDAELIDIEVQIAEVRNDSGIIGISLLAEDGSQVQSIDIPAHIETNVVKFEGVAKGKYAIKTFHDENENQFLDKNGYGMPKEGYGFSNDVNAKFGPPAMKKMLFDAQESKTVVVTMFYYW